MDGHSLCLREAAHRAGIVTAVSPARLWNDADPLCAGLRLTIGAKNFYYREQRLSWAAADGGPGEPINGTAHALLRNKHRTKAVLAQAGIPVPPGAVFASSDLERALLYAAEMPGEVCVKPNTGSLGDLVFPALRHATEIFDACVAVATCHDELLIERSVSGEVWRFFFVRPAIVGMKLSRPANVVGDGKSTIAALIDAKHSERRRRRVPGHSDIPAGHARDFMLTRQGWDLEAIVPAGRRVFLHPASNGAMGADSITDADALHPGYAEWIRAACAAVPDLLFSAADVVIQDPKAAPAAVPTMENFWVLELNASPGVQPFHYPWEGPAQDVCGALIALLCELAAADRAP
ncbi:MAG: hypothetical protein P4M00_08885 [Azospirillaceae bacterium]|nr:hypothetical protein [Azospirillaceae bacterium]